MADKREAGTAEKERFGQFGESKSGTSGVIFDVHCQVSGREMPIRLCSRRTTRIGLNVTLEKHGLTAFRAQDFGVGFCGGSLLNCLLGLLWIGSFAES